MSRKTSSQKCLLLHLHTPLNDELAGPAASLVALGGLLLLANRLATLPAIREKRNKWQQSHDTHTGYRMRRFFKYRVH